MNNLHTYLPQDRLRALVRGETLPDRTTGAALFADISGFTPLTEKLTQTLGARRGIEELTRRINAIYEALIAEVERFGGSVIGFAGDAITCWFDEAGMKAEGERMKAESSSAFIRVARNSHPSSFVAVTTAFALQAAMRHFPDLAIKVAVTSGPARRFVVGDPAIQFIDTLAGATVARLATAEHLADKGDVLTDEATLKAVGNKVDVREWRTAETGVRFAVIDQSLVFSEQISVFSNPSLTTENWQLNTVLLQPWLLPAVFAREQSGHGIFLTELRPTTALFLRFSGIDYDDDEQAGEKLNALIHHIQNCLARYEGTLLQLTIGDKGSYLYASFGAPVAHENDPTRAVQAAHELQQIPQTFPFLDPVQIGISSGTMRTGAYGATTRLIYGAMGDDANLAARLMTTAAPGEILVSPSIHAATSNEFSFQGYAPIRVKGKAEPLSVFTVAGLRRQRAIRLAEPHYALPMIGRQAALAVIDEKLALTVQGKGQIIGITAEAGMGKSRLVAEAIQLAHKRGFTGYGGACESSGTNAAYLVWKPIWQAFFDVDPAPRLRHQIRSLEGNIEDHAPARLPAIPLLADMLNLPIEDNEFTQMLTPKDRRNVLHALLEDCLKSVAQEEPHLLVLEDLHWIDPLSHDLLETLARVSVNLPVCFVLAYRPPETARLQAPRVEALAHFTKIELTALPPPEAEELIRAKLIQLFPERMGALPQILTDQVIARAEGNPFYIEELLNYLHDRGIRPQDDQALKTLELPTSLHTLILSRMDQLTETQKVTLKTASIIGRLFRVDWLSGYYPELGRAERVKADLTELAKLDLTPLDTPEPELTYLFKHIVTREVAYESLPYMTRAQLHEQLAQFIESQDGNKYLDLLAFHYGLSTNVDKQREYFRKAGEAAKAAYANEAALAYYARLLPLFQEPAEQIDLHLQGGEVLELLGRWDEAEKRYRDGLALAVKDEGRTARCQLALGKLCRLRGDLDAALAWLAQAQEGYTTLGDRHGLGRVLTETGVAFYRKGEYVRAREQLNEGLSLARERGDKTGIALALNSLGGGAYYQGDFAAARALFEESLALQREIGNKRGIMVSLNNLGGVASVQGDYVATRVLSEESLALAREMGDKFGIAALLNNLGVLALNQGDYSAARAMFEESLTMEREMGDQRGIALSISNLGRVALAQSNYTKTCALYEESLALYREMGDKRSVVASLNNLGNVALAQGYHPTARALFEESLALSKEIDAKSGMAYALLGLGLVGLAENSPEARDNILHSLRLRRETRELVQQSSSLIGVAGLALHEGNAQRAAQLLGAVEAALQALQAIVELDILHFYTLTLAAARAALSEEAFAQARKEGQALTIEEAIALALEKT